MPAPSESPAPLGERTALMLEAARLLVDELALLAGQNWEGQDYSIEVRAR